MKFASIIKKGSFMALLFIVLTASSVFADTDALKGVEVVVEPTMTLSDVCLKYGIQPEELAERLEVDPTSDMGKTAGQLGLPNLGNWTRFAVALPLGLLAGLYLGDALMAIVRQN